VPGAETRGVDGRRRLTERALWAWRLEASSGRIVSRGESPLAPARCGTPTPGGYNPGTTISRSNRQDARRTKD